MMWWTLFVTFLKIGFLGFGGGYAMLALIYAESTAIGLTVQQFADLNALDLLAPGPIAINSATYVGYLTGGILGSTSATLAVAVPSVVFVTLYLHYEDALLRQPVIARFLKAIKIVAVGLIGAVAISLLVEASGIRASQVDWIALIAIAFAVFARFKLRLNPILVIILSGAIGGILSLW